MNSRKKLVGLCAAILMATPATFVTTAAITDTAANANCSYISKVITHPVFNHLNGRNDYYYEARVTGGCPGTERVRVYGTRFGFLKVRSACTSVAGFKTMPMSWLYEAYPRGIESC